MPELPEIETIVRGVGPFLTGRRVAAVDVRERRLRTLVATGFAAALGGRRVERVGRHGKYLLATLDDGRVWLTHLGMSGQLTVGPSAPPPRAHDHIVVTLEDGGTLTYNDPRRFGRMAVLDADAATRETGPGVDALSPDLTAALLFASTRKRRTAVKSLLMDQRCIAGLGNIYVNEILFRAGVRPRRRAAGLTRAESERIVDATRLVLADAIRRGGSSISDYRDGFGQLGCFQLHHQVYDRAGEPCRRCGTPVRGCVVVGRSTFYCAVCQR